MMKPMLFSVSYAGLWGQRTLDLHAFINKAASLGYGAVELMGKRPHLSILDIDEQELAAIKETADTAAVEIGTIAAYTNFTGGASAKEVPFVEMQLAYVERMARMANALGARIIRIFTGYSTQQEAGGEDWAKCARAVAECAALAADQGIVIGVQNHHDTAVAFESYAEFLDDVAHPNCKAMFDPWAPALHGDNLYECARKIAPRMVQTTLADYVKLRRFDYMPGLVNYRPLPEMARAVPLGEGFVDFEAFFAGLKEGGFSGYVAYEMCSPLRGGPGEENLDRAARTSLDKINHLIAD